MCESPPSLENLCLEAICDNIQHHTIVILWNGEKPRKMYRFRDPELFLFREISEKLLAKFVEKNMLCDPLMCLFSEKNTKLRSVKIRNSTIGQNGLEMLRQHKIAELECINLKNVCIGNVIGEFIGFLK